MSDLRAVSMTPTPGQRRLRVGCEFVEEPKSPVHAVFQVEPHPDGPGTLIASEWQLPAGVTSTEYLDIYRNLCRRIMLPAGRHTVRYEAIVDVDHGVDDVGTGIGFTPASELPSETLLYTLPSRFCPSDTMGDTAFELFGDITPGWDQIVAVSAWVNAHLRFRYGSSRPTTTAQDAFASGEGVCRDFAHLAVTFCRALGFPARYTFGYLPDIDVPPTHVPEDFCAWFEVFLGGRWYSVDPRNHGQRRTGRVVIGRGRDALDVAMVTAFGSAPLVSMRVVAEPIDKSATLPTELAEGTHG